MKRHFGFGNLFVGGALIALAAQPVEAAATVITGVELSPTEAGLELILETEAGDDPQIFAVSQGNTLRADITHTQLRLSEGESFTQSDPAPGIESISIAPLDANSVRIIVNGSEMAPLGEVQDSGDDRLVFNFNTDPNEAIAQATPDLPAEIETVPSSAPSQVAQTPDGTGTPPAQPQPAPDVLVPDPDVRIDGVAVPGPRRQPAPPFLPRAVAPPLGDIAVAGFENNPGAIDLGSAERVPRLVLRNAPARDVLALLARAAGLNLAFVDPEGDGEGPRITLDIENEPVQDVFNHVLRLSDLDASRIGRTIFVSPDLPGSARNLVSRSLRMNQVTADAAAAFLASLGAEATQTVTTVETEEVTIEGVVEEGTEVAAITRQTTTEIEEITVDLEEAVPVLEGLLAIADSRLNSVTLVGEQRLVDMATQYLQQLDLRRRQAAINVKIVDVSLDATDNFGASFSFQVGDTNVVSTGGAAVINFGNTTPNAVSSTPLTTTGIASLGDINPFNLINQFLLQIQAQIISGNAKILTDPTLIVQEGQTASVNLTADVVTNVETQVTTGDNPVFTTTIETDEAGLILTIQVSRIDDNGFVTVNVTPSVTAFADSVTVTTAEGASNEISLLSRREVSSGDVRLRDGQTLILAGIIRDSETTTVSKVPILGDIPILGALFRSTEREQNRDEVIIMLTPQILDDSDQATYGYSYTPGEDVQELLERSRRR